MWICLYILLNLSLMFVCSLLNWLRLWLFCEFGHFVLFCVFVAFVILACLRFDLIVGFGWFIVFG